MEIADFGYHPPAKDSEVALKGAETKEEMEDDEATPTAPDPPIAP